MLLLENEIFKKFSFVESLKFIERFEKNIIKNLL